MSSTEGRTYPGPWRVHRVDFATTTGWMPSLTIVDADNKALLAIPAEMEDLANLIAAAPELLELAKEGLDLAEEMLEGPYDTNSLRKIVARFKDGIDKAEGRDE